MELSLNLLPRGIKRMIRKLTQAGHTYAHGVALPVCPIALGRRDRPLQFRSPRVGCGYSKGPVMAIVLLEHESRI